MLPKNNKPDGGIALVGVSNPLIAHWRGEYALLITILVVVLMVRVVLGWTQSVVPVQWLYVWVVFSMGVYLWQLVGTIRSTDRHLKAHGDTLAVFAAYAFVLVLSVLTGTQVFDALALKNQKEMPTATLTTIPVLPGENAVKLEGNLDWALFEAFKQTLLENPGVESVYLDSTGGRIFVARAVAIKMLDKNLNSHVETTCYSACTVAFMAGQQRTISKSAVLGFHSYNLEAEAAPGIIDVQSEQDKDRLFFSERGLSDTFIDRIFATDHTELWRPDHALLRQAGVIN